MFKKIFFHSITAGALSAVSCYVYNRIYYFSTGDDFSKVVNIGSLLALNIAACLLAGVGFWVLTTLRKNHGEIYFNFSFFVLSFASVIIPISIQLPQEIKDPQIFPGLAVPMHFFPALAWFTVKPFFTKKD